MVHTAFIEGPIDAEARTRVHRRFESMSPPRVEQGDAGASVRFEGIVRRLEAGRELAALLYQIYEPMATREFDRLACDVAQRHSLVSLVAVHSRGRVDVGATSFILEVRAAHRAEAIVALGEFIDRMKQDVPIWKRPIWA